MAVDGIVSDIEDDVGDDGEGGQWARATVNFSKGTKPLEFPRCVYLLFHGKDAKVIRALNEGDRIKANGRILQITGFLGGITLVPCELLSYGTELNSPP